jgi:hypothetical protein
MKLIDKWVYAHTQKPEHYKEVKNEPKSAFAKLIHLQEARQVLYNKWCKRHQYYSGSYLPYKDSELSKQGWEEKGKSKKKEIKSYQKDSIGQQVEYHKVHVDKKSGKKIPTHYHWDNPERDDYDGNINDVYYLDKYGEPCARNRKKDNASHIKPHSTRRKNK